jgi:hypothetical protein
VDKKLGKNALLALLISAFLGLVCKQLLHQPRPYWLGLAQPLAIEATYGNPSTNASESLAVLGYLAYRLNKEWLWATACLSVVLIGFSRLYLGVQFPLGVLCGWLLGLGVVLILLKFESSPFPGLTNLSTAWLIVIAFGISVLMILVGSGIKLLISSSPDPLTWTGFALQARSLTEYFALAGGIFGAACGYLLMKKDLDFQTTGKIITKAGRCVLGFVGLGLIYFSLGWVATSFFVPETIPVYILHYIQIGLVTFWVLFGAPWCFVKSNLAKPGLVSPVQNIL